MRPSVFRAHQAQRSILETLLPLRAHPALQVQDRRSTDVRAPKKKKQRRRGRGRRSLPAALMADVRDFPLICVNWRDTDASLRIERGTQEEGGEEGGVWRTNGHTSRDKLKLLSLWPS